MKSDLDVAVVGGGIGGLALAAALQRRGMSVAVFERGHADREVGAGVGLWSGAVLALRSIGVDTSFARPSAEIWEAQMASSTGAILSRMDARSISAGIGAPSSVVHRRALLAALEAAVSPGTVRLGVACRGVRSEVSHAVVDLEGIGEVRARAVVGADGLRSVVRAAILGDEKPRYSGETCFRGVARFARPEPHVLREIQGPGLRAAVCTLDDDLTYWWAAHVAPEGERDDPKARRAHLLDRFRGFAFDVVPALEATDPHAILRHDLYDRPPVRSWSRGFVTLLGDAAHPTTPNLGQGACMAIEDGALLGKLLADHEVKEAFSIYEKARIERTSSIVRRSLMFGKLAQLRSPIAVRLREMVNRAIPRGVLRRAMEEQMRGSVGAGIVQGIAARG